MKEKTYFTPESPSVQACSHSFMKLVSPLSYIKKSKNYIKEKIKTYTKKNEKLEIYLCFESEISLLMPLLGYL